MRPPFRATHRITLRNGRRRSFLVHVPAVPGPAYTSREWFARADATWGLTADGGVTWKGDPAPEHWEAVAVSVGGRPATTRSKSTPVVTFRVSATERAELAAEAERLGLDGPNAAARRRVFPPAA